MMTQSHFLVTALFGDRLRRAGVSVRLKGLLFGAVAPDLPLFILTLGYFAYRRWGVPLPAGEHIFGAGYDALYFGDPFWIVATSLFHAPLLILGLAVLGKRTGRDGLYWFALGCGLHSAIDVFTHHNDGPLLFFPFDWTYRYPAPISYWHPAYGGRIFARFETMLDALIVVYFAVLAIGWARRRLGAAPPPVSVNEAAER